MIVSSKLAGTPMMVFTLWLVVINTATSFHTGAAKALVLGLGQRRKTTGKEVYYFHVCGTLSFLNIPS